MARRPRPDAFVCENDVLAARLLKTLTALGHRVPQDVRESTFATDGARGPQNGNAKGKKT